VYTEVKKIVFYLTVVYTDVHTLREIGPIHTD